MGLKSQAEGERKILAALNSERETTLRAVRDLQDERSNLQGAVNAEKAELVKTQKANTEAQGAYDETKRRILKLVG